MQVQEYYGYMYCQNKDIPGTSWTQVSMSLLGVTVQDWFLLLHLDEEYYTNDVCLCHKDINIIRNKCMTRHVGLMLKNLPNH